MKNPKLHIPLLNGISEALTEIFLNNDKSDYVVPKLLRANPKWGSRDRSFVAENTYEIVRNKRLILYLVDLEEVRFQNDIKRLIGAWLLLKGYEKNESDFFEGLDSDELSNKRAAIIDPKVLYSMPDDLNAYIVSELGEEKWYAELAAMSMPADVFLRVNTSKTTKQKLKKSLAAKEIITEDVKDAVNALKLIKRSNVIATEEFKNGLFEVQDAGSQLITEFLDPQSGEKVIDACAGAGGKMLHIADMLNRKGEIIAMDIEEGKLQELNKRATRNKLKGFYRTELIEEGSIEKYKGFADKLLLDVPCSGLGVIKRNPDAKESLNSTFLKDIKEVQKDILQKYSSMLKSGGDMVYATCSILPSENRNQVDSFLEKNSEFELIKDKQILPSETGFDGFYMALLRKK